MTIQAVPSLPSNFLVTIRPEITTSNKHRALAWQRPAGVPGPHRRGPWVSDSVPPRAAGPSAPRPGSARLWRGNALRGPGPAGGSPRAGVYEVSRALPVASATPGCGRPGVGGAHLPQGRGPSRCRARGAAPPPAGRAPVSRASQAAPRLAPHAPSAQRPPHSPGRSRRPAARGRRRARRGRRPSPARRAESTSRPRAPRARSAPGAAGEGGFASARGRRAQAAAAGKPARPRPSVMARGAAAARLRIPPFVRL